MLLGLAWRLSGGGGGGMVVVVAEGVWRVLGLLGDGVDGLLAMVWSMVVVVAVVVVVVVVSKRVKAAKKRWLSLGRRRWSIEYLNPIRY